MSRHPAHTELVPFDRSFDRSFASEEERSAWNLAEELAEQARTMMRDAETALETWKLGKEMNRLRCERRGITASDAEIRWSESASSKNALSANSFHTGLATMYFGAATANYARALYLRCRAGRL
jgi:hypothetical protein